MAIGYEAAEWKDLEAGGTPIEAADLNRIEGGIVALDQAIDGVSGGLDGKVDTEDMESALSGKSDVGHKHSASDVTSGTLAVARGGTGATTAEAARTALGLSSSQLHGGEYVRVSRLGDLVVVLVTNLKPPTGSWGKLTYTGYTIPSSYRPGGFARAACNVTNGHAPNMALQVTTAGEIQLSNQGGTNDVTNSDGASGCLVYTIGE